MKWQQRFSISGLNLGLILVCALSACSQDQQIALGDTRAWIDVPRDRSVISLQPHNVTAHASNAAGLRQVTLIISGVSMTMACENLAQPLVTCRANWIPTAPGSYRLEASATSASGAVGLSKPVVITVEETLNSPTPPAPVPGSTDVATLTQVPRSTSIPASTNVPTSTIVPRTPTLTAPNFPTITPSRTPTRTPIPTTTFTPGAICPGAPVISSFIAAPGRITQGEPSTLSWEFVSNATSVEIDHGIGGVGTPGSRTVSPSTTTTYRLTARGCGGTATRQVTILVTIAPSVTPSHIPTVQVPAAPTNLRQVSRSCSSPDQIRIAWNQNSNNETGFRIYRRIRSSTTWTSWSLSAMVGANSAQYTDGSGFGKFDDVEYGVEAYNAAGSSSRPTVLVSECID